jgi:acyl-CoA thioesterase
MNAGNPNEVYIRKRRGKSLASFDEVIGTFAVKDGDEHKVTAPASWSQGRTLYGGMSAALCYMAARHDVDAEIPLRSAMFCFVGPAGGDLTGTSEVLRRGRSTVISEATLKTEQGIGTRAILAFGSARESRFNQSSLSAPDVLRPEACPPLWGDRSGNGPHFAGNFDYHKAGGLRPMSGGEQGELLVWVRFKKAALSDPMASLLALADSLPPAAITMFTEGAPISTITWSMEFLQEEFDVADNWFLFQSIADHTVNGYSSQTMNLWDAKGRPVMMARQNVTIFA